ncbi:MAG: 8-oxoguanine DNA glycosylase [Methanosarcinales archaeon]
MNYRTFEVKPTFTCEKWCYSNSNCNRFSNILRNVALSEDMAILDRHVLRNLRSLGVIEEMPRSLSRKRYLEIEEKMKDFAEEIRIPMSHLDLTLWYRETGEVFK